MGLFTDGFKLLKKASEPLYKTPKSIQETIEIMAVAENGIFEVSKNKYSKCYRFQDINYSPANLRTCSISRKYRSAHPRLLSCN